MPVWSRVVPRAERMFAARYSRRSAGPENLVTADYLVVGLHQRREPVLAHPRNRCVEVEALVQQRHRALLRGVGLHQAVEATRLAGGPEQRQQRLSDGREQQ